MLYAYQITGDLSYRCEVCDTQAEADAFQVSGGIWYISTVTINWSISMYVNGAIVDRPQPTTMLCYSNNGLSYKTVDSTYVAQAGEVLFSTTPTVEQLTAAFSGYVNSIKVQKLADLDTKYDPLFQQVTNSISNNIAVTADLTTGQLSAAGLTNQASLASQYQDLLSQKKVERTAIMSGG